MVNFTLPESIALSVAGYAGVYALLGWPGVIAMPIIAIGLAITTGVFD